MKEIFEHSALSKQYYKAVLPMLLFLQINNEFDQSGTNFPFDTKSAWWKTLRNKMEENRQEIEVGSVKDSSKVPSNCCFTRQA
jgi:hypothetical protein